MKILAGNCPALHFRSAFGPVFVRTLEVGEALESPSPHQYDRTDHGRGYGCGHDRDCGHVHGHDHGYVQKWSDGISVEVSSDR